MLTHTCYAYKILIIIECEVPHTRISRIKKNASCLFIIIITHFLFFIWFSVYFYVLLLFIASSHVPAYVRHIYRARSIFHEACASYFNNNFDSVYNVIWSICDTITHICAISMHTIFIFNERTHFLNCFPS